MEITKAMILPMALHIFKDFEARWAKFEEEKEAYYREGFRPQYCFHGTSNWTDYDNICGPCEDGYGWFDRQAYRLLSLSMAHQAYREWSKRVDLLTAIRDADAPADWSALYKWASEPLKEFREAQLAATAKLEPQF